MWGKKESKSVNGDKQKYNNNKAYAVDGTLCDSILECRMYDLLKKFKIDFIFQDRVIIQEGFRAFDNEAIRPISVSPDFTINREKYLLVIDTKGFLTEEAKLKYKMLKKKWKDENIKYKFLMPRSPEEVDSLVIKIKNGEI